MSILQVLCRKGPIKHNDKDRYCKAVLSNFETFVFNEQFYLKAKLIEMLVFMSSTRLQTKDISIILQKWI